MSGIVNIDDLIASGIHFGHRVRSWNPKMKPSIYGRRNGIHIVDVRETIRGLIRAQRFLEHVTSEGKSVLFVGTKRQASASIMEIARATNQHYVCERWLGGTLTNHDTVLKRLSRLVELEQFTALGNSGGYSKKVVSSMTREHRKIHRNLNGIRNMDDMPGAIVIVDINREHNAVAEARRMKIPTVALVDTDSDPDLIDVVVPGNDDALKAINIFLQVVAEGIRRGVGSRQVAQAAQEKDADVAAASEKAAVEPTAEATSEQPS